MRARAFVAIAALVTVAAPSARAQQPGAARPAGLPAVARYLAACERFGWSGVALIARGDAVALHRGYGLADRAAGVTNGPEIAFEIASTTKPFTAAAVLALVEEGKLALDTSIADVLPGVPEDKRGITIRHLLAHTSGMPRAAVGGSGTDLAAAVAGYLATPRVREPGAAHEYWNGGYALLAGVIEAVTEAPYTDYMASRLFARAGLRATGFTGDARWPEARQAVGYAAGAPVRRAAAHPYGGAYGYQYRGMGGIVTTAEDLMRLTRALLDGELLEPETVTEMLTVVDRSYGLGFGRTKTDRGTTRIGHGGDVRGFHTQLQVFPDEDAAVVLLSNVEEVPLWTLAWNVEALLLGGEPPYPMPPAVLEVEPDALARFAGDYALADAGERITVRVAGGALELTARGLDAAAALTEPPSQAARGALATMRGLVESVAAGDPGPIATILGERIPESWPEVLVTAIYPEHAAKWGALEGVSPVAVVEPRPGVVEGVLALQHADGLAHVRVVLVNGRLSIFDLRATAPDQRWRFAPAAEGAAGERPDRFVTFRWDALPGRAEAARPTPTLRFEPARGEARALVVERPGAAPVRVERVR